MTPRPSRSVGTVDNGRTFDVAAGARDFRSNSGTERVQWACRVGVIEGLPARRKDLLRKNKVGSSPSAPRRCQLPI